MSAQGEKHARVTALQGLYFVATGIWPLASRETFERVTGPKTDFWLAQTVGVLVAGIGGVLLLGAARKRVTTELEVLELIKIATHPETGSDGSFFEENGTGSSSRS